MSPVTIRLTVSSDAWGDWFLGWELDGFPRLYLSSGLRYGPLPTFSLQASLRNYCFFCVSLFTQFVFSFVQVGLDPVEIALRKGVRSQNQPNCFENSRRLEKFAVLKVCHFNFDHMCIFTGWQKIGVFKVMMMMLKKNILSKLPRLRCVQSVGNYANYG